MLIIEQKGFVLGRAECVEHAAIANAIINDAVEKKNGWTGSIVRKA
jgi:hypothetical protein